MREVYEIGSRGRGLGGPLEVVEARPEYREVVVVDRDGGARFGDLHSLHCLLAGHRDNRDEEGRPAGVNQTQADVRVPTRNIREAIDAIVSPVM